MKKILFIAGLALALSVNTVSANAQSGRNAIVQILKVMVSEAASGAASGAVQELLNRMSAPRPDARELHLLITNG